MTVTPAPSLPALPAEFRRKHPTWQAFVRWRTCTRKYYWASERLARNWVYLVAISDGFDPTLVAYDCPFCDGWHVGHTRYGEDAR